MKASEFVKGLYSAVASGTKQLFKRRMTLRYPEAVAYPIEGMYSYDPKKGVATPGWRGLHYLDMEKCTGCQLCALACKNIAEAIEMVPVNVTYPQNKKEIYPSVDYGRCLPSWVEIFTYEGLKQIRDVRVGDKVLTHAGRFKPVTQVFRRRYTGRIFSFKTLGNVEPLTVTEGHPILIYASGKTEWVAPESITPRTYLTRPIIQEVSTLAGVESSYQAYHPAGRGGYFLLQKEAFACTPDLGRLIGYYLAYGHADKYRVSFDIHKKEQEIACDIVRISKEAFNTDVSFRPEKRNRGLKLVIDSVRVASFFHQFGTICYLKQLPSWAMVLPGSVQAGIVKGVFRGDGHYSNHQYKYMRSNYFAIRTTSKVLANQLTHILARLGIVSSVSKQDQKGRRRCYNVTVNTPFVEKMAAVCGVVASNNPGYSHNYVKMVDGMIISPVVNVSVEDVNDLEVFNLEVEEDNSYVANNQIVHNCVFCGFCVDPSTPVVTNSGLKPISQVEVGDMLLTHTGDYRPVTKVWDMLYSGPLYRIHVYGRPEPLICTKDHRIMAVSRPLSTRKDGRLIRSTAPIHFYTPNELKAGDYMISPIVKKVVHTDFFEKDVPMYRGGVSTRHLKLAADPDLFRLIGYYMAEGFTDGGRSVKFSFHMKEEDLISDVRWLCTKFFSKEPKIRKNTGLGVNVVLDSALAEDFFLQFGHGAGNKELPDWVFFAENEKLVQLVKGIWLGDGCRVHQPRQEYLNFATASQVLAFQLQEVLAKLGVVGLIEGQHQKDRLPIYHVNVFGRWALKLSSLLGVGFSRVPSKFADKFHLDGDYTYLPIKKIEVTDVKDYRVMDVTVDGDHTFAPLGLATSNCIDACPFYALFMTNDVELSELRRNGLFYTPLELYRKPQLIDAKKQRLVVDYNKGAHHE